MKCPDCSATLVYNPESQLLECRYCGSKFRVKDSRGIDITKAEEENKADDGSMEYTKFTCRSCGAELVGTENSSAIGFCPYCGGESILESRLKEKTPKTIIPFSRTKKECCEQYMQIINSVPLVPDELKHRDHIEEIRGIYVPYNIYHAKHTGKVHAEYNVSSSNSTSYYSLKGDVDADISVPIDGSIQLDDNIGNIIFPYSKTKERPFDEKYLATFYAELPDANDGDYEEVIQNEAIEQEMEALKVYSGTKECTNKDSNNKKEITVTGKDIVLAPAYFLTYRNNDRVCYTIIPGAGDKYCSYAEIPVDVKKYFIYLAVIAAVIWTGLSFIPFIPTFKHTITMGIIDLLGSIAMSLQLLSYVRQKAKYTAFKKKKSIPWGLVIIIGLFAGSSAFVVGLVVLYLIVLTSSWEFIALGIAIACFCVAVNIHSRYPQIDTRPTTLLFLAVIAMTVATWVSKLKFFDDGIVYTIMVIFSIPILLGFFSLIKTFNEACSRPLPHFTRKGGHNEAKDL